MDNSLLIILRDFVSDKLWSPFLIIINFFFAFLKIDKTFFLKMTLELPHLLFHETWTREFFLKFF